MSFLFHFTFFVFIISLITPKFLFLYYYVNCRRFICLFLRSVQQQVVFINFTKKEYISFHFIDRRSESTSLSTTVLTIIWVEKSVETYMIFAWVNKITSDCWHFLRSRLITFRKTFAIFTATIFTLYRMPILR